MRCAVLILLAGALLVPPVTTSARPWDLTLVEQRVPAELEAARRLQIHLVLRNDGTETWAPEQRYAVSYHWRDSAGEITHWDGVRTPLPGPLAAGGTLQLDADLVTPDRPGSYLLQWDVVQEGVRWLGEVDPSPLAPIPVTVVLGPAFSVAGRWWPRWMAPDSEVVRRFALRNDGSLTWRSDASFAVSYHWSTLSGQVLVWDGVRTRLPAPVAAGATAEVEVVIRAPQRPGWYRLQLDLVHEGVIWFSQRDPTPEPPRTVVVLAAPKVTPATWACAVLGAAVLGAAVVRAGRPRWALGLLAFADLWWLAGSLQVKQAAVLAEAGLTTSLEGRVLSWAGAALLVVLLAALPVRVRSWLAAAAGALVTLLLAADILYQRFFGDILSLAALGSAGQAGQVRASVGSLLVASDGWLWADLVGGVALVPVALNAALGATRPRLRAVAAAVVLVVGAGAWAGARLVRSPAGVLEQVFRAGYLARDLGVLNAHAWDLLRELGRRLGRAPLAEEQVEEVVAWFAQRAPTRAGSGPWFGAGRGRNLLMVQAESLQGLVLGLEVNGQEVTPFLNRWARGALVFTNVTDQTAQGRSSDSGLLTQTSLLPPTRGTAAFLYAGDRFTGLAGILAERGYDTLSAVPFDGSFWNRRLMHPAYGYERSLFAADFSPGELIGWGLNDRDFLAQMAARLALVQRPFCAWLLTLGLHHPFEGFPESHEVLDVGSWEGSPFGGYLHTMSYFDRAFEGLIASLERAGIAGDTVVVVWGDHDAGLEWRPELARLAGRSFDDAGWYLSQRVPLVIHVPGQPALVGAVATAAGHQDVAPTLLALLGVDPAPYAFIGRNLLGSPGDLPVVGEYHCWQDASHLYLQRGATLSDGECYALETMQRLATDACRDSYRDASRQLEISALVLEHDLQQRLHPLLLERLGVAR